MDKLRIKSTSLSSAECSDIVLRETNITRLVFRPMLVENPSTPAAAVKGTFMFLRKGPRDEWVEVETIPLSQLKKGDAYKLAIDSSEILLLYKSLTDLYKLHSGSGIPLGDHEFVPVNRQLAEIAQMAPGDLQKILAANHAVGSSFLMRLITWATHAENPAALLEYLIELPPLASVRSISRLISKA
ncbi:MAG: hypothetical protein E8D52_18085 [Nitrospira sp.]|nr:MAG: hypothetical protein E8D52_18085 [Nitrospira sp.]